MIDNLLQRSRHAKLSSNVDVAVLQFYFLYEHRVNQTASKVLGSIVKQLLVQLDSSSDVSVPRLGYHISLLLPDLSQMLIKRSRGLLRTYLFLDAVDECDPLVRDALRPYLQAFLDAGIKISYTARPDVFLNLSCEKPKVLKIVAAVEDLHLFLRERVDLSDPSNELSEEQKCRLVNKISSEANGMYRNQSVLAERIV
jgi:hypothetical protein